MSLLSATNINKVIEVANKLKVNPVHLLAVMYFETGKTLSPATTNSIGSVGLIQFTRDKAGVNYKTIGGKRYNLSDLKLMSFDDQMDVVYAYLKEAKGSKTITSFTDLYLLVFFPLAVGKPDNFVFATSNLSAKLIAQQNPIFDLDKDHQITKGEVVEKFRQMYNSWGFNFDAEINVPNASAGAFPLLGFCGVVVFFTPAPLGSQ